MAAQRHPDDEAPAIAAQRQEEDELEEGSGAGHIAQREETPDEEELPA